MEVMDEFYVTVIAQYHEHFSYSDYHWYSVCYSNCDLKSIGLTIAIHLVNKLTRLRVTVT